MLRRTLLRGFLQGDVLAPLVFVLILCVPQALSQSPGNPTIVAPSSALEGSTVNFTCSSIGGNPLPAVTWYRGNTIVDQTYDTSTVGSVTVTTNNFQFTVYRNDSGVSYRCEVNNVNLGSPLTKTWYMTIYVQPGAPTISGPSVVTAGSTYTHRCVTSSGGIPVPTLAWKLGTQSLDNLGISNQVTTLSDNTNIVENNVTWVPVASDNGKTLSCELSHNETLGTSKLTDSIVMTVQVLPNISTTVTSYSRTVGTSVTLQCSILAASPSVTSVYWTRLVNSQTTTISIDGSKYTGSSTSNPSLTINPLATTDAGVYTCNAVNSAGTGSGQGILLSVSGTVPTVQIGSSTYTVNAGNTAQLVCSIISQNPSATSVTWQRLVNNVVQTIAITGRYSGGTTNNPSLTISNTVTSDEGTYYCYATNSIGNSQTVQTFLDIQSAPTVSIPSSSYPVSYNSNTTLICSVTSTPNATAVNWYRVVNNVDTFLSISGNSRLSGGTTSNPSLTVTFAVFSDEGSYKCEAMNSVGTTRSTATFLDVIGSSPNVSIPISSYSAVFGNSVTIACTVTANPSATSVSWQQIVNSQSTTINVNANPTKYSGSTTSTPSLTINSLVTADSGYYVCSATNAAGTTVSGQTYLNVTGTTPTVSANPTSYSQNYGTNATLQCSVSGNPSVNTVYWTKTRNGVTTNITTGTAQSSSKYSGVNTGNPSLQIISLTTTDGGTYVCFGVNSVGSSQSSAVTLNVIGDLPSVSIGQSSYSVTSGNSVTLNCSYTSTPSATGVSWQRTSNGVSTVLSTTGSSKYSGGTLAVPSLTVFSTTSTDEGFYTCSVTNAIGTASSSSAFLDVVATVPSVSISAGSYSVNYGSSITIPCSVTSNPFQSSVYWQRTSNGATTTLSISGRYSGATVNSPALIISGAVLSDAGSYVCFATNSAGTGSSNAAVLTVNGSVPSVTIGSAVTVIIGNNATIQCSYNANPSATAVAWERTSGGQTVQITIGGRFSGGSTSVPQLIITNAQSSDEGSYRCLVTNAVGQGQSGTVFLDVQGNAPTVNVPLTSYSALIGTNIQFPCSISANPATTSVYWIFNPSNSANNVQISQSTGRYTVSQATNSPALTITNVTFSDTGSYTCTAVNVVGTGTDTADFNVTGSSPTVDIGASSYTSIYGTTAILQCTVTASPSATSFYWEKTANSVSNFIYPDTNTSKYGGMNASYPSLEIYNVNFNDEGIYTCFALNLAGTGSSSSATFLVNGSVPAATVSQSSYAVLYGNDATLSCTVSGVPSVSSVYWEKTANGSTSVINSTTDVAKYGGVTLGSPSVEIYNVDFDDDAIYVCKAVNLVGTGSSVQVDLTITGSIPTISIGQTSYSVLYGENATLGCSISASPDFSGIYWEKSVNGTTTSIYSTTNLIKYGGISPSDPSLEIYNVNFEDGANYTCHATNLVGTGKSDITTLIITGSSPSVSIAQSSYSVLTGNSITIPCTISATPAISTRYWIFDPSGTGNNVQISASAGRYTLGANTNSPSLTISNAVTSDAGTYTCYATNLVGTTADSATLTLTGDEPNITISVTSYSVLLNANVTLTCEVPAAQPSVNSVAWRFRTQGSSSTSEIDIAGNPNTYSGGSLNTPSLTITQVGNDQEGYYICTATNLVGTGNGTEIFLNVSGSGPSVSIPSSSYSVLQTQTVSLQCNVNNASPQITAVTWYYSATNNNASPSVVDIAGNSRYTGGTTTSPSLNITNAQSGDAGYYRCSATNAVATATSGYTSLSVTGAIPSGTSISGDASQSVDQTNTLTLTCSASGDPTPTITWSFNGQTLSSTNGVYTKVNVQRADDGEYTCTATNSLGSQTDTVDIDVRFAPVATSSAVSINAATGSTQTLTCAVEANPGVTYQWTRNSQVVGTNSRTYSKTFGTGDFGNYICTATNTLGTATVTFTVSQSSAGAVGAATAGGGLTTGEIAAIVLAVLLILLLIIVICICCCTHGVCGAICGKKKDPKGRVEPVKEKEVYKETIRHIEIPRFEEKPKVSPLPPIGTDMPRYEKERDREGRQESFRSYPYGVYKRREHSAVSRRDVDVNVKRENDYDIVRYETVPPAYYGDTIIAVQDDVRPSPRPHRLPALTTTEYTYEEAERRRKHRRKKKKHRRRHDDEEVIVERVRTASPVRYVEEPAQDVIIETVRRSPSTRRKRSDEEEMIVRTPSRSPSRRRRHEERYVTTERVVNGDVYRDGGDLRAINGEVYRDSGEYTLSRHGSGRYTRESRSGRRKDYAGSTDVEVVEGSEYYVERR